jgi:hypothetical protein
MRLSENVKITSEQEKMELELILLQEQHQNIAEMEHAIMVKTMIHVVPIALDDHIVEMVQ